MDYKIMHDKKNRPKLEKDGVAIVATLRKLGIDRMEVNYPIFNLIIMHWQFVFILNGWMFSFFNMQNIHDKLLDISTFNGVTISLQYLSNYVGLLEFNCQKLCSKGRCTLKNILTFMWIHAKQ